MNYEETLRYLNRFVNYERILHLQKNRSWNLERMQILLDRFGHPEKSFFPILIAGTKGKGSTGFFLEQILQAQGISTGFYSSPHLEEPTERIRLGGRQVSQECWAQAMSRLRRGLERIQLPERFGHWTYFEILTLLAILIFSNQKVRVGIFEVGLGGRLDATNVLRAPLAVITPISFDHEAILGATLSKIAFEKAGIIHQGTQVVTGFQKAEAMRVIQSKVLKTRSTLWNAKRWTLSPLGLRGAHQEMNAGLAVEASDVLGKKFGISVSPTHLRRGLTAASWPGRLEKISSKPEFWIDGAHNTASVTELVRFCDSEFADRRSLLVFGTSRDKNSRAMLEILSRYFRSVILTSASHLSRAREAGELLIEAQGLFDQVWAAGSVETALQISRGLTGQFKRTVATGSFYVTGAVRKQMRKDSKETR